MVSPSPCDSTPSFPKIPLHPDRDGEGELSSGLLYVWRAGIARPSAPPEGMTIGNGKLDPPLAAPLQPGRTASSQVSLLRLSGLRMEAHMKKYCIPVLLLLALILAAPCAWARGGGGCIEEGAQVLTPAGPVAIEHLRPGDTLLTTEGGRLHETTVQAKTEVQPVDYLELSVSGKILRATPEHPFATAPGVFTEAKRLKAGDVLYLWTGEALEAQTLDSVKRTAASRPAFNLTVFPGGTYLASGVLAHNKGGGCFLPDTPVLLADGGERPIQDLRPGDEILAFTPEGKTVRTTVEDVVTHEVEEYVVLRTETAAIRVTSEHPFYVGDGTYKTVEALRLNDRIYAREGNGLRPQRITAMERIREPATVYNLRTDQPHTYFAAGIAVHNKGGGCFAAGTTVAAAHGKVPIESLAPGMTVYAAKPDGSVGETAVEGVYSTRARILTIHTEAGDLRTTAEHPLMLAGGDFRNAGDLKEGESLAVRGNEGPAVARILAPPAESAEEEVYNLRVDEPHTFFADGFAVHNKGGSSGHSSSSHTSSGHSSGSSDGSADDFLTFVMLLLMFFIFPVVIMVLVFRRAASRLKGEKLDVILDRNKVASKAKKTAKLIESIAQTDLSMQLDTLRQTAETAFRTLQQCWQAREYGPMKPLLMPDLYAQHCAQLEGMVRNHEINMISKLKVEHVDVVHLRYTANPEQREFTALITAVARDYYVDDRTQKFLRGDSSPGRFQEFYVFHYAGGRWLLREIEQTRESDALKDGNYFEKVTDLQFGEGFGGPGALGAPQEDATEKKTRSDGSRIDKLLDKLAKTDKLWLREYMKNRARLIFTRVYMAREAKDVTTMEATDLFPAAAAELQEEMAKARANGLTAEFRNFCVRKVDIVLARNFPDSSQDEFTARISAHALTILKKNGEIYKQDDDIASFEEFWTFGRLDGDWKLKEMRRPAT